MTFSENEEREPNLSGIARQIWQKKLVVVGFVVAAFLFGILYLRVTPSMFTAELKVTAASSSADSVANRLGNLGGLAAAAGLPIGGSSKAEPFDLYLEALTSRGVADQMARDSRIMTTVFRKEWDADRRAWRRPPPTVTDQIKDVLGIGTIAWRAPDGARLREYLQKEIVVTKNSKSPITSVQYDAHDPVFAVYLLQQANRFSDNQVRSSALQQATEYQAYLTSVLPSVVLTDVRKSLSETLAHQYESVMMAKSTVAYAALPLSAPQVSTTPTKPKAMIVLALSLMLGVIVGLVVALVDFRRLMAPADVPANEVEAIEPPVA